VTLIDFEGFDNHPRQPHNTCGQAVIASIFQYARRFPFPTPDSPAELMDRVLADYGPNWPFRNMITHPKIILRALRDAGIEHKIYNRATLATSDVLAHIRDAARNGHPVIVLLDVHALKMGKRFTLHWAVVIGYDDDAIYLSSWGRVYRIMDSDLLRAMNPWFMPRRYTSYAIVV
jgi:hypothetical protein